MLPSYLEHKNIYLKKIDSIYFDVPKVASSSIKTMCAQVLEMPIEDNIHFLDFPYIEMNGEVDMNMFFKFGFVRDPWDRLVSCYRSKVRAADFNSRFHVNGVARAFVKYDLFYGGMSFAEFVEAVIRISEKQADPHFASQYISFPIKQGKLQMDFIGRFENLPADYNTLATKLGTEVKLVHLNNNKRTDYRAFYTTDLIYKVYNRYQRDIHLFGYHFE